MTWAAGIDLGGTRVKAVAVTTAGAILAQSSRATRDGESDVDEWVTAVQASLADFTRQLGSEPTAVGVAAPGLAAKDGRCIAYLPGKLAGLERLDWTRALARSAVV